MTACWINAFKSWRVGWKSTGFMCWKSKFMLIFIPSYTALQAKRFAFQWQIHTEPPLRHLNPKLDFNWRIFNSGSLISPTLLASHSPSDWHPVLLSVVYLMDGCAFYWQPHYGSECCLFSTWHGVETSPVETPGHMFRWDADQPTL